MIAFCKELGHDLGIGIAFEHDPLGQKLVFKLKVIFDYTVVDKGDAAVHADMGMGVPV